MRARTGAAIASVGAGIAAVVLVVLLPSGGSGTSPTPRGPGEGSERSASGVPKTHPRGAIADCSARSEANFPAAFADPGNLVVGPLVLVGGAYTPASTIREFGGNKFPALVRAGHTVTVRLPRAARGFAEIDWGPTRRGPARLRHSHHSVTLVACRPGRSSGSSANGPVTFWSGWVGTSRIGCVPLDVYVDDEPVPRHVGLSMGRRCPQQ